MTEGEDLLDKVSEVAFARLKQVGGNPLALPLPLRVVAVIYAAQGAIDNGGLRYFFECDWPGQPPYAAFAEAFRAIGANSEADVLAEAAGAFALQQPESDRERRCELLSGAVGEQLDRMQSRMTNDVWQLLAAYARSQQEAFLDDGRMR